MFILNKIYLAIRIDTMRVLISKDKLYTTNFQSNKNSLSLTFYLARGSSYWCPYGLFDGSGSPNYTMIISDSDHR